MERSPEIEAVSRRLFEALRRADADALRALVTPGADLVTMSAFASWDPEGSAGAILQQASMFGGTFPLAFDRVVGAWAEGDIGWSGVSGRWLHPGHERDTRTTAVFRLIDGQWKAVQWHHSVTASPEELFGPGWSIASLAEVVGAEQPDLSTASAPDGTVTILFTDIEGSTQRNVELGDRAWMDVLRRHNQVVRSRVAAHDGFEVKSAGDGFMVAFASARKALRCAASIQAAVDATPGLEVRVRVGLHTGEVVKEHDDFFGGDVALAARIAAAAKGGQVLCSALVQELVSSSGEFRFSDPTELDAKGFDEKKPVYELLP